MSLAQYYLCLSSLSDRQEVMPFQSKPSAGDTFPVGSMLHEVVSTVASSEGPLYLWTNDSDYSDNYGYFVVRILVRRAAVIGVPPGANMPEGRGITDFVSRPNPFNPDMSVDYALAEGTHVTVRAYDSSGRIVGTLVSGYRLAGKHSIAWDGRNEDGRELGSGVYFIRVETAKGEPTTKAVLLR